MNAAMDTGVNPTINPAMSPSMDATMDEAGKISGDMQHARFSPSAAHRWMLCAASIKAESGFADKSTIYTATGNTAHTLAARCLINNESPHGAIGHVLVEDGFSIEITMEMADNVDEYVNYVRGLGGDKVMIESRVDFSSQVPGGFGTADHIAIHFDERAIDITDFKYGKGVRIPAEQNQQGLLYALGAVNEVSHLMDVETIRIHIHQPRLGHVDVWSLSYTELMAFADAAGKAAEAAMRANPEYTPGPQQCKWCKAKASCAALTGVIEETVLHGFPIRSADHAADNDNPEKLAHALGIADMAVDWARAVEARATQQLELGHAVPGYKLVVGHTHRKWGDEQKAEAMLRKAARRMKLRVSDLFSHRLLSAPAMERKIGKQQFARFAELVVKPEGRPVIAAASDKRPAINRTVDPTVNQAEAVGFSDLTN